MTAWRKSAWMMAAKDCANLEGRKRGHLCGTRKAGWRLAAGFADGLFLLCGGLTLRPAVTVPSA